MPAIHPARENPPARLAGWSPGGGRILLKQAAVGDGLVRLARRTHIHLRISHHRDVTVSGLTVDRILANASKMLKKPRGQVDTPDNVARDVTFRRQGQLLGSDRSARQQL
jgi:hypothetical protein